jgi:hypothetical protein
LTESSTSSNPAIAALARQDRRRRANDVLRGRVQSLDAAGFAPDTQYIDRHGRPTYLLLT